MTGFCCVVTRIGSVVTGLGCVVTGFCCVVTELWSVVTGLGVVELD